MFPNHFVGGGGSSGEADGSSGGGSRCTPPSSSATDYLSDVSNGGHTSLGLAAVSFADQHQRQQQMGCGETYGSLYGRYAGFLEIKIKAYNTAECDRMVIFLEAGPSHCFLAIF